MRRPARVVSVVLLVSSGHLAGCFPSLPPEDDTTGGDTVANDGVVTEDTASDIGSDLGTPPDVESDVVAPDIGGDAASGRWISNLPAEVPVPWGRAGAFQVTLTDGVESPTLRFSRTASTCAFEVEVASTTGSVAWTCPAAVARCAVTIEAHDGERRETGELTVLCTNRLPEVSDVLIEPAAAFPGETMNCKYSFTDADGDEDKSAIAWFVGPDKVGEGPVLVAPFAPTKEVSCVVTPDDGAEKAADVVAVQTLSGFVEVSVGGGHTCARANNGSVR
jgi:hypothetical protein